jgi:hypothetical protein
MAKQHLDHVARHAQLDFLPYKRVRHRVVVAVAFDVIVEPRYPGALELGIFEARARQWPQRRPVEELEPTAARAVELLKRPVVEFVEQRPDGAIELSQAVEAPVAQAREDPAFHEQHAGLDLGLVLRLTRSCRQDGAAIVLRQRFVRAIGYRLVAIRIADQGACVIGHQQRWRAAKKAKALTCAAIQSVFPSAAVASA